jgi:hypothetical protein
MNTLSVSDLRILTVLLFQSTLLNASTVKYSFISCFRNVETAPIEVKFDDIRPRARHTFSNEELQPAMVVFVNYNIESPKERGYWYDFEIKEITRREIKGTLLVGKNHAKLENCTVKFNDEIMKIEKPTLLTERTENWDEAIPLSEFSNGFFFHH